MSLQKESPAADGDEALIKEQATSGHSSDVDTAAQPYCVGAPEYLAKGWKRPLPLLRGKGVVPKGVTGWKGQDPSPGDIQKWRIDRADSNICLIVPEGVVGIDVDHYDAKRGGDTLAYADAEWGPRPPTWRSTARIDGLSGIQLYRLPEGTSPLPGVIKFTLDDGTVLSDIELVQHHHRNVNCWPSKHVKTGNTYQWLDGHGHVVDIPHVDDLPILPQEWVSGLESHRPGKRGCSGERGHPKSGGPVTSEQARAALRRARTGGLPSARVQARLNAALADLLSAGCRYDSMLHHSMALLRFGYSGEPGVDLAMDLYSVRYKDAVALDRDGGEATAANEFDRSAIGAGELLAADRKSAWGLHSPLWDPLRSPWPNPLQPPFGMRGRF